MDVEIDTEEDVYSAEVYIHFNPDVLNATSAVEGNFLKQDGASTYPVVEINNTIGRIEYGSTRFNTQTTVSGNGTLATITFRPLIAGSSELGLVNLVLVDGSLNTISGISAANGTVDVV